MTHTGLDFMYLLPAIGAGVIVLGLKHWKQYENKLLHWRRLKAQVVDVTAYLGGVECSNTNMLKYMYDFQGKEYVGFNADGGSLDSKVGDSIEILVDPENPFDSIPDDELKRLPKFLFVFGTLFLLGGSIGTFLIASGALP